MAEERDGEVRYEIQTVKPLFVAAELDLLRECQPLLERCARGTTQLYLTLQSFVNHRKGHPNFGCSWPSQNRLAFLLNVSDRQVRFCMAALRDLQLIQVQRRGRTETNLIVVDLLLPVERLVDMIRAFPGNDDRYKRYREALAEYEADGTKYVDNSVIGNNFRSLPGSKRK